MSNLAGDAACFCTCFSWATYLSKPHNFSVDRRLNTVDKKFPPTHSPMSYTRLLLFSYMFQHNTGPHTMSCRRILLESIRKSTTTSSEGFLDVTVHILQRTYKLWIFLNTSELTDIVCSSYGMQKLTLVVLCDE